MTEGIGDLRNTKLNLFDMEENLAGWARRYDDASIPFILQVAALLAAFTHPSHIVIYAPGDSFTCRRAATRNLLGIYG
ncbi:hypothetical protein [Photorhabdus asymbiotica]|uniref:Uncharacterized protein n=1 Tax=Photorhabdus asymbiotica TaxID=291112 RepID=A0ABX9SH40_9GAMM|nr:hypothetical protein [Photorhabdus asymbiotica]RKS54652.1 hypothetical protein BDD30_4234 [Photorhabdus asymbiotica]